MSKLLELVPEKVVVVESVKETLTELLVLAEEGRIAAVGIAVVYTGGNIDSSLSATEDPGRLLGAIGLLSHRVVSRVAGEGTDD